MPMRRVKRQFPPTYSPTALNAYQRCPHRYYLKYVKKIKGRIFARPDMARGRITHEVLARAFRVFAGRGDFPANLRADIAERVGGSRDISAGTRASEVALIQSMVDSAIETFDRRKTVSTVERQYRYEDRDRSGRLVFTTRARVDLVAWLDANTVEHIDWKTGKPRPDDIQTVASRLAVGTTLGAEKVRSTTTYLGSRQADSRILPQEEVNATWAQVQALDRAIKASAEECDWPPHQSALCTYCEYFQHGCSLHSSHGSRG